MVTLQLQQLDIPLGQRLLLRNVDWEEFEAILAELGEHRSSRIAYYQGDLEIIMPSPKHEREKSLISDAIKILLEELEIDCECFGSTTFKRQEMGYGIEPDECFYIKNHQVMVGKERLDLATDPPPDLALEIDATSKTQLEAYLELGVPELWIYEGNELKIYILEANQYQQKAISTTFSQLPIPSLMTELLDQSRKKGRSPALRNLRKQMEAIIEDLRH